ncbi:hypothetical protein [Enterococcus phage vB_Efs19_KEN17]
MQSLFLNAVINPSKRIRKEWNCKKEMVKAY